MQKISIIDEGIVSRRQLGTPTACAGGPRAVVLPGSGEVVCTFMVQEALGRNDFKPMITRSRDGGRTWSEATEIWPKVTPSYSVFGSISRAPSGELYFYATRYRIDKPGEPNWSEATKGLKENELSWARSTDGGHTWSDLHIFPMQLPGSAEAPGPIVVTQKGRWACCYAPYNTFDPNLKVDRSQLAGMFSDDHGMTWKYQPIMRFSTPTAGAAEAWLAQLADGRLLATTWCFDYADSSDFPNQYALSSDDGRTWEGPFSTGIRGQSTGLMALPDGRAVMVYNQRKQDPIGVHMAVARPTTSSFNVELNAPVWQAQFAAKKKDASLAHDNWQSYAFGEPSSVLLPDGDIIVFMWCAQPDLSGIRWVRVRLA
jgi:hypothetical protein